MGRARFVLVAACMAAALSVGAGAAFAGEITGNGKPTGISHARSLCAFSGLNDFIEGQTESRTQTPKDAAPGSAAFGWAPDPSDPSFILVCNPNGPVSR